MRIARNWNDARLVEARENGIALKSIRAITEVLRGAAPPKPDPRHRRPGEMDDEFIERSQRYEESPEGQERQQREANDRMRKQLRKEFAAKLQTLAVEELRVLSEIFEQNAWEALYTDLKSTVCAVLEEDYYGELEAVKEDARARLRGRNGAFLSQRSFRRNVTVTIRARGTTMDPVYTVRGFLPADDPATQLDDKKLAMLDELGHDLPSLLIKSDFRSYVEKLDIPAWPDDRNDAIEQQRLYYIRLGFLASAYVNQVGQPPSPRLPANVAQPLCHICGLLGRPPILSYDGYALYNWKRFDTAGPIALGNIDTLQNFVHSYDEHWFILVHVEIEAIAAEIFSGVVAIQQQLDETSPDTTAIDTALTQIANAVGKQVDVLRRIPEQMSPMLYYSTFRPYIRFFENVVYEGVQQSPANFRGETGAQSSIMPSLVALMKIPHEPSMLMNHLADMRNFMPVEHRRVIEEIEAVPDFRSFASPGPYNAVLDAMAEFREIHFGWAQEYINKYVDDPRGTGGTTYMHWLQQLIDETKGHRIRKIHLYDVTLTVKGETVPLVRVPELVLVADRKKLADEQEFVLHRADLLQPVFHLVRDPQGKWNWQRLPALPKSGTKPSLPELIVAEGEIHVELQQSGDSPSSRFQLQPADLKLVPKSRRSYLVKMSTDIGETGKLSVDGEWDIDRKTWSLDGDVNQITSSGELLGLAVGASPELRHNIGKLEAALRKATPPELLPKTPVNSDALPDFGASGTLDISFRFARTDRDREPEFGILAEIRQARIANPALPFPLHDIAGKIRWDNGRVAVEELSAKNGLTRISIAGEIRREGDATPGQFRIKVIDLPLDRRLHSRLPPSWRKTYDTVQPTGHIDLAGMLHFDGRKKWTPSGFVMTLKDCTGAHLEFPYRVRHINGTVVQRKNVFDIDVRGLAGRQKTTLVGYMKNLGPNAESLFDISVNNLPFDETFLAACDPEVRRTLKSMGVKGTFSARYRISRRTPGLTKKFHHEIAADITGGSIEYDQFPYRMKKLNGRLKYDSNDKTWRFIQFTAENGTARFGAAGTLTKIDDKQFLQLKVGVKGAHFDNELRRALPESLETAWNDASPTGKLDLTADLRWSTGRAVDVSLSDVNISDGSLHLKAFPYPLSRVKAKLSYGGNRLLIHSFQGWHDETFVRAQDGWLDRQPNGEWQLRLNKFWADDIDPGRRFRRALSKDLRSVVEELDPKGPISVSGMLDLRGTGRARDPMTAAWDLNFVLSGNSLTAGILLKNLHGSIHVRGTWDGRSVDMGARHRNRIDLASATINGYQFTNVRGPYRIDGKVIVVGSEEALRRKSQATPLRPIPDAQRLMGRAIDGDFTLDGRIQLDATVQRRKTTVYQLMLTMSKAQLRVFANRYLRGSHNVAGVMYGRLDLFGYGASAQKMTGHGKLLISPAALYELPILAQMFQVMNFTPPDKTAFKFAYADFEIANSRFLFNSIDLVGDSISLRGRGSARFDGRLNLDFFSMMPRNQLPIPVVREILSTATNAWVGVEVRGTTSQTMTRIKAVPQLDDALKRFLGAFGARPPVPTPFLPPPRRSSQRTQPIPRYRR
eukprot:g8400.t1